MTISRRTTIKTLGVVGAGSAFSGTVLAQTADEDDELADEPDEPEIGGFRVAHFSPDAPDVDVYVDEQHVLADVAYDDVSPYLEIASGSYQVTITAAGDEDAVVFEGTLVVDGGYYTAAAVGELGEMDLEADEADEDDATEDEAEADADDYDDESEDEPAEDDDLLDEEEVDEEPEPEEGSFEVFLLVDREPEDVQDGTADLRIFHASPGAPNVDIVDEDSGRTLVEDAEFAVPTGYRAIEPGDRTVGVYPAGEEEDDEIEDEAELEEDAEAEPTDGDAEDEVDFDADEDVIEPEDPIAEAEVEFDEGLAYTVFAIGYLEEDEDEMAADDDVGLDDDEDDRPFELRPLVDGTREDEEDDVEPEEDQLEPEEEEVEEEDEIDDEPEEVEPDDEPVEEEPAEEPVEDPEPEPEDEPPVEDEPADPPAADD